MENALIVSTSDKSVAFFADMLHAAGCGAVTVLKTGAETRRLFPERDFDIVIIYSPLPDESGESLSRFIASKESAQVILVVKGEYFEEMSAVTEDEGILVVAMPVDRALFWIALKLAKSAQSRLRKMRSENIKLKQKIEDIRVVDRAKYLLISYLNMSEQEAHRFIEKQAMDMRTAKRAVAEGILRTYES
ncbi:MAG: ANTAR domain-containing protein [Chitinispirillia bacterium]|nr:ANTAR domain-containing protein [Chitinispirillia bacterium]MCL2269526.1 ANTAR domain-containing protein [Chitinispirillia bacterium]